MSAEPKIALVTGDCVVDHHWYAGDRQTPDSSGEPMRQASLIGGAGLLLRFVRQGWEGFILKEPSMCGGRSLSFEHAAFFPQRRTIST